MVKSRFVALRCDISRGGFSDERLFSLIDIAYNGVASRRHLWKDDGSMLDEGEPPLGQAIKGLVAARIIEVRDDRAIVSMPDGETIDLNIDALQNRPQTRADAHVSI